MSGIIFGNIQGNVTVSGTMAGRDIIEQSGLAPEDQAILQQLTHQLEQALAVEATEPQKKESQLVVILRHMMSLSADVTAKVLPAILLKRFGV